MKVLLVVSDGMRPDAVSENDTVKYLMRNGTYSMTAKTVMPSSTLPCHMSMFHSVDPERHGIKTSVYVPQEKPVDGLFEQLDKKGKNCAMFYNWEQLRDVSRPDHLSRSVYVSRRHNGYEKSTREVFDAAMHQLKNSDIDFAFLYLVWPDEEGHDHGWMSERYMYALNECCDMVGKLIEELGDEYVIIYTADHGGHGRGHGTELYEDMTIPMFFLGKPFEAGKETDGLSIKDIAPTVADLLDADIPSEWEGKIVR